jgi:hypothetical protein
MTFTRFQRELALKFTLDHFQMALGLPLFVSGIVQMEQVLMRRSFTTTVAKSMWTDHTIFVVVRVSMLSVGECQRLRFMTFMRACPVILQNHNEPAQPISRSIRRERDEFRHAVKIPSRCWLTVW